MPSSLSGSLPWWSSGSRCRLCTLMRSVDDQFQRPVRFLPPRELALPALFTEAPMPPPPPPKGLPKVPPPSPPPSMPTLLSPPGTPTAAKIFALICLARSFSRRAWLLPIALLPPPPPAAPRGCAVWSGSKATPGFGEPGRLPHALPSSPRSDDACGDPSAVHWSSVGTCRPAGLPGRELLLAPPGERGRLLPLPPPPLPIADKVGAFLPSRWGSDGSGGREAASAAACSASAASGPAVLRCRLPRTALIPEPAVSPMLPPPPPPPPPPSRLPRPPLPPPPPFPPAVPTPPSSSWASLRFASSSCCARSAKSVSRATCCESTDVPRHMAELLSGRVLGREGWAAAAAVGLPPPLSPSAAGGTSPPPPPSLSPSRSPSLSPASAALATSCCPSCCPCPSPASAGGSAAAASAAAAAAAAAAALASASALAFASAFAFASAAASSASRATAAATTTCSSCCCCCCDRPPIAFTRAWCRASRSSFSCSSRM